MYPTQAIHTPKRGKKKICGKIRAVLFYLLIMGIGLCATGCDGGSSVEADAAETGESQGEAVVFNFYPDKARYAPGDQINLAVELINTQEEMFSGPVKLSIRHIDEEIYTDERLVALNPGEVITETFSLAAPSPDFTGYLATATAGNGDPVSTGIDVSSTAVRFPRYGYVTGFSLGEGDDAVDGIRRLAREFHLNMFQFYDWFWRHEKFIKRENGEIAESWSDLFGRINYWRVVLDLVDTAHEYNALAMSYVMSYIAREGYAELWDVSPDWGIFDSPSAENQLNVQLGTDLFLFLFDPANPGWQDWMIAEYLEAINLAGFDGLHIDQLGPRYDVYTADGNAADLPSTFPVFLSAVKEALVANDPDNAVCTFNLVDGEVDGWAVPEVVTAQNCDFIFSELWYETNTYDDLNNYIEYLHEIGGDRAVVLAGYSNYNQEIGPINEAENAAALDGVAVASNHPGYTGTGFVDGFDEPGDAITWNIDGPEDTSKITFVFRFANATGITATRNVYLDGQLIGQVQFGARDQWSTWASDAWVQAELTPGEHTVRLAFDEGNDGAVNIDHLRLGEFDENSVRLENAVIFASGATHIQLGDNIQALAREYYPDRSKSLTPSLRRSLERKYDFITAYENLLFDPELEYLGAADDVLSITTGQPLQETKGGRIFTLERRSTDYEILHFINLIGLDNELWRDAAPIPEFQDNVGVRFYPENPGEITVVYLATPDFGDGTLTPLDFAPGEDDRGRYIEFTIPRLEYWDMILMKRG